ncbi:hypothetical protein CDAR_233801 [Caerostris darwini]|uniref:Uncharacterized protein n=1 Tax=Caerostris darwini TaxID=1538125 RepID=A0AAV4PVL3_9ARAC|nr:hypothetical protein CDAR_233801 [Caerostris darwini]
MISEQGGHLQPSSSGGVGTVPYALLGNMNNESLGFPQYGNENDSDEELDSFVAIAAYPSQLNVGCDMAFCRWLQQPEPTPAMPVHLGISYFYKPFSLSVEDKMVIKQYDDFR